MKTIDFPDTQLDPVISEVRAVKREIVAEHDGNLDTFFAAIRHRQSVNPRLVKSTGGELVAPSPPCEPPRSKACP